MLTYTRLILTSALLASVSLPVQAETVYVSNEKDNSVSVIDGESLKVTSTIKTGRRPRGIVLSEDMTKLYVCIGDDNRVDVIDLKTGKVVDRLPSGPDPELMALHPDGHHLYIAPDSKHVWVSAEIGGTVSVIDSAEKKVIHKIRFEIPGVSADAIQPVGVKITKDGKRAFVALGPANRVAEIDPATYEVKKYYLVGQRVWNMALGQNETRLYTTNGVSSDVSVIDLASEKVVKSLKVGRAPWGVVVKP